MLIEVEHLISPRLIVCVSGSYSGGGHHCLPAGRARDVIRLTQTNAIVVHIPLTLDTMPEACLGVDEIEAAFSEPPVPLLNTSRATTASQACAMLEYALDVFSGPLGRRYRYAPLLKLEILDDELRAVDSEVLEALTRLPPELRNRTLPILTPTPGSVAKAVELGCPIVRLMSGRIGQRTGIVDPTAVRRAIAVAGETPVTLEGGIDTGDDVRISAQLGATAVLVNSAFVLTNDPLELAKQFRRAADDAWGKATPSSL